MENSIINVCAGKKFNRVSSSHVSYSGEEIKKMRREFYKLKNLQLTQGKLSAEQNLDYERMRQILVHYGLNV